MLKQFTVVQNLVSSYTDTVVFYSINDGEIINVLYGF